MTPSAHDPLKSSSDCSFSLAISFPARVGQGSQGAEATPHTQDFVQVMLRDMWREGHDAKAVFAHSAQGAQ